MILDQSPMKNNTIDHVWMNSEIHETLDLQIAITKNQTVKIEIKSKPLQEIV